MAIKLESSREHSKYVGDLIYVDVSLICNVHANLRALPLRVLNPREPQDLLLISFTFAQVSPSQGGFPSLPFFRLALLHIYIFPIAIACFVFLHSTYHSTTYQTFYFYFCLYFTIIHGVRALTILPQHSPFLSMPTLSYWKQLELLP